MIKKVLIGTLIFMVIFIGSCIRRNLPKIIDASVHSWTEVRKPIRIKPLNGTRIIVVTNKCFDKPFILPSPSGDRVKLGNGIWVADIAMLPGQGVREKTKVLVETIEE